MPIAASPVPASRQPAEPDAGESAYGLRHWSGWVLGPAALILTLVAAGQVRLRPILMTTGAMTFGMLPLALGLGEGAEQQAPMGRAIIGGVITSTLLTLLMIPTFYDSMEIAHDRLVAKFKLRASKRGTALSALLTALELLLAVTGVRFVYRLLKRAWTHFVPHAVVPSQ